MSESKPAHEPESASTSELASQLYEELLGIARRLRRSERDGHTLETEALVHEAFLRLATQHAANWQGHSHFLASATVVMRRVLVDYARARRTDKRDGGIQTTLVTVTGPDGGEERVLDVLALDEVLNKLAAIDPRQATVVEHRIFGGFSVAEIAELLGVSTKTVQRDWEFAKAWLACELTEPA